MKVIDCRSDTLSLDLYRLCPPPAPTVPPTPVPLPTVRLTHPTHAPNNSYTLVPEPLPPPLPLPPATPTSPATQRWLLPTPRPCSGVYLLSVDTACGCFTTHIYVQTCDIPGLTATHLPTTPPPAADCAGPGIIPFVVCADGSLAPPEDRSPDPSVVALSPTGLTLALPPVPPGPAYTHGVLQPGSPIPTPLAGPIFPLSAPLAPGHYRLTLT